MKKLFAATMACLLGLGSLSAQEELEVGAMAELTLTLDPAYVIAHGNFLVYSPDSDVMKARYVHYYFAKENFAAVLGPLSKLAKPVKVNLTLARLNDQTRIPGDSRLPSPEGGFTDIRYLGVIRSLVK